MIDWLSSMSQTYEFYEVDPGTWKDKKRLTNILSCKISRDLDTDTLYTASISTTDILGEMYIRVYLVVNQNGETHKEALGTFLTQTPSRSFDGKQNDISIDAYSPLLELKDNKPDLGFTLVKNQNIMDNVCRLTDDNMRAPVFSVTGITDKLSTNFTAESDESWLSYLSALMYNVNYSYGLDESGRVLFNPKQDTASLQPKWTYTDDNSSILYPEVTEKYDLYKVPNVVEVVYSGTDASGNTMILRATAINDEALSPTSTVSRGRIIKHREINPSISGIPDQKYIDLYAERLLKEFNDVEHKITYTHGYCPVTIGECVRLNYERADLTNVKAKIISQDIDCTSGCKVTETAVYTTNLWKE